MYVYRICKTKFAYHLLPSGIYGRWNSEGQRMIYAAGSVALACLENVVHRSGAALASGEFSIAMIHIEEEVSVEELSVVELIKSSPTWYLVGSYHLSQGIGDKWLSKQTSAVLKVPSAIIDLEYNYLFNPLHPDFSKIKVIEVNPFKFDSRLKSIP